MHNLWQVYLLLSVIIIQGLCLAFGSTKGRTAFLGLCFVELVFIAGFRSWSIGNDTLVYVRTFIGTVTQTGFSSSYMEKGYLLYNKFIELFTSNPQGILLANALLITSSIFLFIKRYSMVVLLPVLLFVILEFGATMCIMRQFCALAIILLVFPFVVSRRFLFFLLGCLVATSFHYSALIALGIYFLYPLSFKTKYLFWILVVTVLVFIFLAPILEPIFSITGRYEGYQGGILLGEDAKIASIVKFGIQFVIVCFCYFSYRYFYHPQIVVTTLLRPQFLLWCSIISACLQFVSIRGTVLERLTLYYSIFSIISIPFFVHCYPKKLRILVSVVLLGCFVVYQSVVLVYRPTWNHLLPFEFCF